MKIGAAILFIIFLTIVGVGVFAMGEMNGHESCLATAINGFSCPTQSIVGEAFFHLNAARALTALLLIAPFLLLIFMVALRGSTSNGGRTSTFTNQNFYRGSISIIPQTSRLIHWRALHETSPTEE